jgi:hypothetical protein
MEYANRNPNEREVNNHSFDGKIWRFIIIFQEFLEIILNIGPDLDSDKQNRRRWSRRVNSVVEHRRTSP